jgi:hypothetical protein
LLKQALAFEDYSTISPSLTYKQASQNRIFFLLLQEIETTKPDSLFAPLNRIQVSLPSFQTVITILLVFVLSFGTFIGGAQAADTAAPGDLLYPVDLTIENLRLAFATGDKAQMMLLIDFSRERIREATSELLAGHIENGKVALVGYENQIQAIADILDHASGDDLNQLQKLAVQALAVNALLLNNLTNKLSPLTLEILLHAISFTDQMLDEFGPTTPSTDMSGDDDAAEDTDNLGGDDINDQSNNNDGLDGIDDDDRGDDNGDNGDNDDNGDNGDNDDNGDNGDNNGGDDDKDKGDDNNDDDDDDKDKENKEDKDKDDKDKENKEDKDKDDKDKGGDDDDDDNDNSD